MNLSWTLESFPSFDWLRLLESLPEGIIPHHFNCPILQDIMKDPVKTVDGHIYDRYAIERWFTHNNTSTLTGLTLQSIILEPQNQLKNQITKFLNSLKNTNNVLELDDNNSYIL